LAEREHRQLTRAGVTGAVETSHPRGRVVGFALVGHVDGGPGLIADAEPHGVEVRSHVCTLLSSWSGQLNPDDAPSQFG